MQSSVHFESLLPLRVIRQKEPTPWGGWLEGTILFVDIAGFTPMAEKLGRLGAEGAEFLTNILNRYFTKAIGTIHNAGGEIIKFSGDAVLCLFTGDDALERCIAAAITLQQEMGSFKNIRTPIQRFSIQIKAGIASGEAYFGAIGNPEIRSDFFITGPAVNSSILAEQAAKPGEIIASPTNVSKSTLHGFQEISNGFFKIISDSKFKPIKQRKIDQSKDTAAASFEYLSGFLIPEIHEMIRSGFSNQFESLLHTVPVFMEFSGFSVFKRNFPLQSVHEFFNDVVALASMFEGNLSEVTMGDKGNNFLFYFGAPTPIEKKEKSALEWAVETREMIKKKYPKIRIKIGASEGRVYTGIVGGAGRLHYTVVGDSVNLASRIMQNARINEIHVTEPIYRKEKNNFKFTKLEAQKFKGKSSPVAIYNVLEKVEQIALNKQQFFFGRTSEIGAVIRNLLQRGSEQKMCIIEGEPGVGKSAFCEQIVLRAEKDGWNIFRAQSEITRRFHSYAAWRNIFKELGINFSPTVTQKQISIDSAIYHEQKLADHHDLCLKILNKISHRKAVVYLEDLHWFDSLSLELLASFLNHLKDQQVCVLATSRPEWNKNDFVNRRDCSFLTLKELDRKSVEKISAELLNGELKDNLAQFLYVRSQGNPFVLKTVLDYLIQNKSFLKIGGEWTLKEGTAPPENQSLEDLVASNIKKLKFSQRNHLETAACMGPTFSVKILKRVLGKSFEENTLQELYGSQYLLRAPEDWSTFRQSLLQEVIYYSLPLRRRKKLHYQIGIAMEAHAGRERINLVQNLANHFQLAQIHKKAILYSIKAADQLMQAQSYPEAVHYLMRAYELLNRTTDQRKWSIGLKYAEALIYAGKIERALNLSNRLRKRAQRRKLRSKYYNACAIEFDAMRRMSNYSYLSQSRKILKNKSLNHSIKGKISYLTGSAYFRLGQPENAERHLTEALMLQRRNDEVAVPASIFLASIAADRGQNKKAEKWILSATVLAEKAQNHYQKIRIQHEWAGILADTGRTQQAISILNELLPKAESLGAYYLIGAILISLGQTEIKTENWNQAISHINEASALFHQMGMLQGKAQTTMLAGVISFFKEEYSKAYDLYLEATKFYESVSENVEACHGYYNLAEVCLKLNKKSEARFWFDKGLHSFTKENNPQLSDLYSQLKEQLKS